MEQKKYSREELENMSFEQVLALLEEIVGRMEGNQMPLEDMIGGFEQGTLIANVCRAKLAGLERKIELLVEDDGAEGRFRTLENNPSGGEAGPRR